MRWPATCPLTIQARLTDLANRDLLSGVPPQVLAAICRFTSNYGQPNLAVNQTTFGGYFGQHVGWPYPTGTGSTHVFTRTELVTKTCFTLQARCAAATLASYGVPLGTALNHYSGEMQSFVSYVLETTGATPSLTFTGKADTVNPSPAIAASVDQDGQKHVYVITPANAQIVRHWWQASTGTTKWHRETLPEKTTS